jgi:hypothetical protein
MLVLGLVVIAAGILTIRFAAPIARFFYSAGRPLFGTKLAARTYTPRGEQIGGAAWIAFGCILLVISALSFTGAIHPQFADRA